MQKVIYNNIIASLKKTLSVNLSAIFPSSLNPRLSVLAALKIPKVVGMILNAALMIPKTKSQIALRYFLKNN